MSLLYYVELIQSLIRLNRVNSGQFVLIHVRQQFSINFLGGFVRKEVWVDDFKNVNQYMTGERL